MPCVRALLFARPIPTYSSGTRCCPCPCPLVRRPSPLLSSFPVYPARPLFPHAARYPCLRTIISAIYLGPWSSRGACITDRRQGCGMSPRRHHVVQATMCIIY
ncbi:hypothetical protein BV20DRAFT_214912 [Pilatotrama ljubarskyi]|nr:hypothetical protein BV20DRAFT_214912 [Pilatotrama ljubarskyi]